MENSGMIPLFYNSDIEVAKNVLKACYYGGSRLLEFTNRGDFAFEIFKDLNKFAINELPGMILGVGSVTDSSSASQYMLAGANFVVTPVFRKDIATICNRRKVLWSPGCGSLTEISRAEEMGCELIKLFPGSVYGPEFVKAIKGPQPWTSIMPTGGVNLDTAADFLRAGSVALGVGGALVEKSAVEAGDFGRIEALARQYIQIVADTRNE